MRDWLLNRLGGVPNLEHQIALDTISRVKKKLKFEEDAYETLRKHNSELLEQVHRAERLIRDINSLINGD